jgi:hypothetical protein
MQYFSVCGKVDQVDENLQKSCIMGEKLWTKDDKLRAYSSVMCNLQRHCNFLECYSEKCSQAF